MTGHETVSTPNINSAGVEVVSQLSRLAEIEDDWNDLAENAVEQNAFYEPWFCIPAIEHLGGQTQLLFIWDKSDAPGGEQQRLVGFFPLEEQQKFRHASIRYKRLWKHNQCFLCTPLVRKGAEKAAFGYFFDWLRSEGQPGAMFHFEFVRGDGPFISCLNSFLNESGIPHVESDRFERALIEPPSDSEEYIRKNIGGKNRKEYRRLRRRLSDESELSVHTLDDSADAARFAEEFLQLESSGWKGEQGDALLQSSAESSFVRDFVRRGYDGGHIEGIWFSNEQGPVAMKLNLLTGDGAFAFKICYDEQYSKFSPGVLLELEYIDYLSSRKKVNWCDSCAAPVHFMINRLWSERRVITSLLAGTGNAKGNLIIWLDPKLKALYHFIKRLFGRGPKSDI